MTASNSNSSRRNFLKTTTSLAAAATINLGWGTLLSAAEVKADPAKALEKIFTTKPHLQGPSEDSVGIVCSTPGPAVVQISYGIKKLDQKAFQIQDGQIAGALTTNHLIRLEGLTPGATYQYQVTVRPIIKYHPYKVKYAESVTLPVQKFKVFDPAQEETTFLLYNDVHDNMRMFEKLQSLVDKVKYDAVVGVGDIFDDPATEAEILKHLGIISERIGGANIPLVLQRGNHETRGEYCLGLKDHLSLLEDRYYYAFTHANTRFIALDTGEDKGDSHPEYSGLAAFEGYIAKQTKWLKRELASEECQKAKHRIVFCHIPLYDNTKWISKRGRKQWASMLNEANIDLFFSGHTHKWKFHKPGAVGDHNFQVIIGGGRKLRDGTVSVLRISKNKISLEMIQADGKILDTWTKEKN